jgi:hypothetical protein
MENVYGDVVPSSPHAYGINNNSSYGSHGSFLEDWSFDKIMVLWDVKPYNSVYTVFIVQAY